MQPVHRLINFNAMARRREKLSGKRDWFCPCQGHWKSKLRQKEEELTRAQGRELGFDPSLPGVTVRSSKKSGSRNGQSKEKDLGCRSGVGSTRNGCSGQPEKKSNPAGRTEGVLFVPHSPDSGLARMLQKEEDTFAGLHQIARVKVVERGGARLHYLLGCKDLWARSHCGKGDCLVCCGVQKKEGTPTPCRQESICYYISCDRCKAVEVEALYYGESARTCYLCGKEHLRGQVNQVDENPLWKHDNTHHWGGAGVLQHGCTKEAQGSFI